MSRFRTVFLLIAFAAAAPAAAFAADTEEMIYRASLGRADDVRLLVKQGTAPDTVNDAGVPVLALASSRKDLEGLSVVEALIDSGADINAHDRNGQTALFYAAKQGNVPIVNYLLNQHANAYAVDTSGNQARMVAYMAGQNDVVAAMDAFAQKETESVKQLTKSQNSQNQLSKENADLKQQLKQKEAADAAAPTPLNDDAKKVAYNLSYHSCAFQYWSFVYNQRQSTELSPDELDTAVSSYQEQAEADKNQLANDFKAPIPVINNTITSAQQRIFNDLNTMHSNTERHEQGVGKRADINKRCETIAKDWEAPAPAPLMPKLKAPAKTATPATAPNPAVAAKPRAQGLSNGKKSLGAKPNGVQDLDALRKVSDDFVFSIPKK